MRDLIPGTLTRAATPVHSRNTDKVHPDSHLGSSIFRLALGGIIIVGKNLLDTIIASFACGRVHVAVTGVASPFSTKRDIPIQRHMGHSWVSCHMGRITATNAHPQISTTPVDPVKRQRCGCSGSPHQTKRHCRLPQGKNHIHIILEPVAGVAFLGFIRRPIE